MTRLVAVVALLFCASCASVADRSDDLAWVKKLQSGAHSLGALTQQECALRDGVWGGAEGAEVAMCTRRVTDGGKACSDHLECQGFCVTPSYTEPGKRTHGFCSADYYHADCIQGVSRGRAEAMLCRCG